MFFDEAIERGRWLDEYLAKEGKVVGPLHGVPVSVKVLLQIPPSRVGY